MPRSAPKNRKLTVSHIYQSRAYGGVVVPMIRLVGRWLRDFGFRISDSVNVYVGASEIRLTRSNVSPVESDGLTLEGQIDQLCAEVVATMNREGQTDEVGGFVAAQRAWESYRDAEVAAIYPPQSDLNGVAKIRRDDLRAELAQGRLRQLRGWWE